MEWDNKHMNRLEISLASIEAYESIHTAIIAKCREHPYLAAGKVLKPIDSFSVVFRASDYDEETQAAYALNKKYGACGYINAENGRLATLGQDGDVVWSENTVVYVVVHEGREVSEETMRIFKAAVASGYVEIAD